MQELPQLQSKLNDRDALVFPEIIFLPKNFGVDVTVLSLVEFMTS